MKRRLQRKLDYGAAEKVGHKWVLTDFMIYVWGAEKQEITENMNE